MWIFKKAYTTVLFLAVFLAGMFISMDFSPATGLVEFSGFEIAEASAQGEGNTGTPSSADKQTKETFDSIVKFLNSALGILTILVSPLIMFASWLMSPDWVTGDIFSLRGKMYSLWMTVSNILYFIYAIFLIVIAIATIFNSKNYGYKLMLPRLFIGILLVPATWWFVQFIISTSTGITATVLKIPGDLVQTSTESATKTFWNEPVIPKTIVINDAISSSETLSQQCSTNKENCITPASIVKNGSGIYSPLLIYGYGIFKIQDVKTLTNAGSFDIIKNIWELVNGLIFSMIMMLVFGVLIIALVFILFVRAIKLWMYAIFSPLFSLKFIFRDQWKDDSAEMFTIKEFVGLAFVPAIIGLALSFGLIVAATISAGISSSTTGQSACDMTQGDGCPLMSDIMGNPNNKIVQKIEGKAGNNGTLTEKATSVTSVYIGGLELQFKGSLEKGAPVMVENGGSFISGFGTIIVQFIALIFIWIAFVAASKVNKGIAAVVEPFENFGKSLKNMSKTAIQHVPLPLVGNVHGLGKAMNDVQTRNIQKLDMAYANSSVGKAFGKQVVEHKVQANINQSVKFIDDHINNKTKLSDMHYGQIKSAIQWVNNSNLSAGNKNDTLKELLTKIDKIDKSERNIFADKLGMNKLNAEYVNKWISGGSFVAMADKLRWNDADMKTFLNNIAGFDNSVKDQTENNSKNDTEKQNNNTQQQNDNWEENQTTDSSDKQ